MTREKTFKRTVRSRMSQTGESYTAARAQVLARQEPLRVAITNGDSVRGTLTAARLADEVIAWKDDLHEGPVPTVAPARLRRMRAQYLAARYLLVEAEVERELQSRDRALSRHARGPLMLWFEADLYDQLQLIQVLARLRQLRKGVSGLSLISVGEHPDRAHFGGLGELTGDQLAALLPQARPLSGQGLDLADRAWRAFTASEPDGLTALRGMVSPELRHLGEAIGRLLQEYPSVSDGLSLTQRRVLLAVARGIDTFPAILRFHWQSEPRPFLADLGYRALIADLTSAVAPALAQKDDRYELTDTGRRLLAGSDDWIAVNGIDRWIGGVRLFGRAVRWRYDERHETLVLVKGFA